MGTHWARDGADTRRSSPALEVDIMTTEERLRPPITEADGAAEAARGRERR